MSSLNQPREQSAADYHRVLADSQRRLILSILQENDREYAVADLAKELASRKQNSSAEDVDLDLAKRIHVSLHHRHIPMMVDAGLIRFDEDTQVVELASSPSPEN